MISYGLLNKPMAGVGIQDDLTSCFVLFDEQERKLVLVIFFLNVFFLLFILEKGNCIHARRDYIVNHLSSGN